MKLEKYLNESNNYIEKEDAKGSIWTFDVGIDYKAKGMLEIKDYKKIKKMFIKEIEKCQNVVKIHFDVDDGNTYMSKYYN